MNKTAKIGSITSPTGTPIVAILSALPRFLSKLRAIVVIPVWGNKPCPNKRTRKKPITNKIILCVSASVKQPTKSPKATVLANRRSDHLSIQPPTNINAEPDTKVAKE